MSHTMDPNIPNGIPSHLNGLESRSSQSSRDSSPSMRMFAGPGGGGTGALRPIPASQLPPSTKPAGSQINQLANNYANMNLNRNETPHSSPSLQQHFHASTPTMSADQSSSFTPSAVLSPIPSALGFTHSANSHFSNVAPPPATKPPQVDSNNAVVSSTHQPVEQPAQLPSQQVHHQAQPQVPSMNRNVNGGQLPHQNSLPPLPTQTQLQRPPMQTSLSQPRMMGYNYPSHTQASPNITNGVTNAPPPPGGNVNMNNQNIRNAPPPMFQNRQPTAQPPQSTPMPSQMNVPPYQVPSSVTNVRTSTLQPQQSTPNFYNQRPPPQMPPKSNSLTGPDPQTNISQAPTKNSLFANRYPQTPMQTSQHQQLQSNQPHQLAQPATLPPPPLQQQQQNPQFNTNPMYSANTLPKTYQQSAPYMQQHVPLQQQMPPQQQHYNYQSTVHTGFNKLWGGDNFDLLQIPNVLPPTKLEAPSIALGNPAMDEANCSPDIFRCTITKIPESNALLQKSRLPLGILIHPFRDLTQLPVIQCNSIVRCRACRTYINPFVFFVDNKRWKCNLCYRLNELPEEFQYDPVTKTYGDPSRRPEVRTSTIEYIAPAEYMLRPPQPAVYLFLFDISRAAIESGYLQTACATLAAEMNNLPGDARTHLGFIAYDSAVHFYSFAEGLSQPHEMTVLDIDDIFLPCPDNLLVNLQSHSELIGDLLTQLPTRYNNSYDTGSALGAALQAAHKLMSSTGGRITVFQSSLPTIGPGALTAREDPSNRASGEVLHLNPANDFYKRLALECSGQQIAVDLFVLNSQYVDIATLSGICRFSGGCMYHFPLFKASRELLNAGFEKSLKRYLTRKIGFEAVMRIRCTRGLSIHTFHGNFFVRSTDLLSLPNVNPDAGYGMQVSIEESLSDVQNICFQAALLYTSSKGERRIRVHTLCLPVVSTLSDIINSADQQCIVGLLAKMAVDRSMQSNLSDAREAFLNVAIDILSSYKLSQNMSGTSGLIAPRCLRLLPLYISAMLKHTAFRTGVSTRLDDRVKAMCDMKTRPLQYLIQHIYPDLYPVHNLQDQMTVLNDDEEPVHMPPILQLSARNIDSNGAYLFDMCEQMILVVCSAVSNVFLNEVLGVPDYNSITDLMTELPVLDNDHNQRLHMFINYLNEEKPMCATLQIIRENSPLRGVFLERLVEDRVESALSYHEFLQHLKTQVK